MMTNSTSKVQTVQDLEQKRVKQSNLKPWYKHAHLWLVIVIPILAVTVSGTFVVLAFNGKDDLVRDDWYMDGKTLEQDLSRDTEASLGQYQANLSLSDEGHIEAHVASEQHKPIPTKLVLNFFHATKAARDRQVVLTQQAGNKLLTGRLPKAESQSLVGKYTIELDGVTWRLRKEVSFPASYIELDAAVLVPVAEE